jgi:trk system potassium uptake protein
MKFVIIGLGNFGAHLGQRLIEEGHEVIGVDNSTEHVEHNKDKLTYVVCADTTEEQNVVKLPIDDADFVIVSIGEDVGASLTSTALIKKHYTTKIIARGISYVHKAILETMNVHEIINPEAEYANQLAERFSLRGSIMAVPLDDKYEVAEIAVPAEFVGKTVRALDFPGRNLSLITILRKGERSNFLGKVVVQKKSLGIVDDSVTIAAQDILVLFGKSDDLRRMCNPE